MNRRDLLKTAGFLLSFLALSKISRGSWNRKRLYGMVNYRARTSMPPSLMAESYRGAVFVNGREIRQVWYVDTDAGIVKTYDVLLDGHAHMAAVGLQSSPTIRFRPEDFPGREVECPVEGIVSETLRGRVQLYGPKLPA